MISREWRSLKLDASAAEGKNALRPFGQAPQTQVEYESADSPANDSYGRPAARSAIEGVTDGKRPGDNVKLGYEEGGPDIGSGNSPLGTVPLPLADMTLLQLYQRNQVKSDEHRRASIWAEVILAAYVRSY